MSERKKILAREFRARGWVKAAEPWLDVWTKNGVTYEGGGWADYRGSDGVEIRMELSNGTIKTPARIRLTILEAFANAMEPAE